MVGGGVGVRGCVRVGPSWIRHGVIVALVFVIVVGCEGSAR